MRFWWSTTAASASSRGSRGPAAPDGGLVPAYPARVKTRAVALYETGLSCRAVAAQMKAEGLPTPHFASVLRWARAAGKGRRQHGHRLPLSGEDVHTAYDAGVSVKELARRFRVGTTTVYKRLAEAGTKMR